MQSHFGGLALDVPLRRRGLNDKKATEAESNDTNISKAKRYQVRRLGMMISGGIIIPGSRIRWLQGGEMLLTGGKKKKK